MKKWIWNSSLLAFFALVMLFGTTQAQDKGKAAAKAKEKAPDLSAMKLDFERYRRIWNFTNSQYMGSLTQQQKEWLDQLTAINAQLVQKKEALTKALDCEAQEKVFNDDLLQCDPKPPEATKQ